MKKTLILCILFIGIGFLLGKYLFVEEESIEKYYFLQEGIYQDKNIFENNLTNLKQKVMEYKNNRVYVYTAITKDYEIAERIQKIYEKQNINLSIEEVYLPSEELKVNVEQFDLLIKKSTSEEEILKIQEVVLANYEEIIKNKEDF